MQFLGDSQGNLLFYARDGIPHCSREAAGCGQSIVTGNLHYCSECFPLAAVLVEDAVLLPDDGLLLTDQLLVDFNP